jgi:hypothetical protein
MALLAVGLAPLVAQSLGDIAKKEEERRKAIKHPSKVITNDDLKPVPPPLPPSGTAEAAAGADKADEKGSDKAALEGDRKRADDGKDKGSAVAKDQKYWSVRRKDLATQLERDQSYSDALQTKIDALTTDFANRDDPVQRAAIARERQRSLDELDRLKKAIEDDKKAISDLEEEARRAGVPPGWLRS